MTPQTVIGGWFNSSCSTFNRIEWLKHGNKKGEKWRNKKLCQPPISPLPPTPVASPSHEASEDVIYDSLPPMEQSTVSESPLKDPMEAIYHSRVTFERTRGSTHGF
ncbi:hypothetical protein TNCV_1230391 [Trichonephila clavipes]|nr:hypothetical protein TNCV_1230391 [Trichonephila clavipes]